MRILSPHSRLSPTIRGAAIAVTSFCVLSWATIATANPNTQGPKLPETSEGPYSINSASETLATILKDAQERGFVRGKLKPDTSSDTLSEPSRQIKDIEMIEPVETENRFNCAVAETLNFSDLEAIQTYESLTEAKEKHSEYSGAEGALYLSRAYLALGLGEEVIDLLATDKSDTSALLKQAAKLIDHPERRPERTVITAYKDCSKIASVWAYLEDPTQFPDSFTIEEIREILYTISDFPPLMKERIQVNIAIAAAENGQTSLAHYIWLRLENAAREAGQKIPEERITDFDYLYLSALLQSSVNSVSAADKLNFLSERDSVYRPNAVKALARIQSQKGEVLTSSLEGDLQEISAQLKGQDGHQEPALELVKGQIRSGRLIDGVHSTLSFLEAGTPEFLAAKEIIVSALISELNSENAAVKSMALNTYLREQEFFKKTDQLERLKSIALQSSINLGMPELVVIIQKSSEAMTDDQVRSLQQAQVLLALKTQTFGAAEYNKTPKSIILGLEDKIINYALNHSNMDLAKLAIRDHSDGKRKQSYQASLAWITGEWNTAHSLSISDKMPADNDADTENFPNKNVDTALLMLLSKPVLGVPVLTGANWKQSLSSQLSDVADQVQTTKAFLKHG